MKAIVPLFALTALLAACAAPPRPAPVTPPVIVVTPPPPTPLPQPLPKVDWRDMPQTPGIWRWELVGGQSVARFIDFSGAPLVELRCDTQSKTVTLSRSWVGQPPMAMYVYTTGAAPKPVVGNESPAPGWIGAAIPARDPLLDAIAFSRGRFAIMVPGRQTYYLPAWPEISRVVEDCR